jgi:hypothetical protein
MAELVPAGRWGHAPRAIGYGPRMDREKARLMTLGLFVGGLVALLVVLWFVLQYARG